MTICAALLMGVSASYAGVMENIDTALSLAPVEPLVMTQERDKVFPASDKVTHCKVTFVNRYGITLAADMYRPKGVAGEIRDAVLVIHGEKAHSRYFGEDAFRLLRGDNKELLIVEDASHTDLYDNLGKIPFSRIAGFFDKWMPKR